MTSKVFSMSTRDDAAAAAQRATWTKGEELALLERYFAARKDPSKATDKGVKSKAWEEIKTTLNAKLKKTLDKGQYKSKVQRLMQDYDLFKEITSLSGCGTCPQTGKPLLDDDVWDKLIEAKPSKMRGRIKEMRKNGFEHETICSLIAAKPSKMRGRIKEMRKNGFEHETICSLIAGDSRATGADAESVQSLLGLLEDATEEEESALPQPNETLLPDTGDQSSVSTPAAHPSHERRVQTYKMRQEMGGQAPLSDSAAFAASPSSDD
eukprot:jgi/Phyca11/20610/fgenesh1_pg.PHYCAscaffold_68_\